MPDTYPFEPIVGGQGEDRIRMCPRPGCPITSGAWSRRCDDTALIQCRQRCTWPWSPRPSENLRPSGGRGPAPGAIPPPRTPIRSCSPGSACTSQWATRIGNRLPPPAGRGRRRRPPCRRDAPTSDAAMEWPDRLNPPRQLKGPRTSAGGVVVVAVNGRPVDPNWIQIRVDNHRQGHRDVLGRVVDTRSPDFSPVLSRFTKEEVGWQAPAA
jgi:hypothetical protein